MCDRDLFLPFHFFPWIVGIPKISKLTGFSRKYVQHYLYFNKNFPLRIGPSGEFRLSTRELWIWLTKQREWEPGPRRLIHNAEPLTEEKILEMSQERLFISGWQNISDYIGMGRRSGKLYHQKYNMPVFFLEKKKKKNTPRIIPHLVDLWFFAWDRCMRQERRKWFIENRREDTLAWKRSMSG